MATLLEKLQQNLGGIAGPAQSGSETQQVQRLLAARKGITLPAGGTQLGPQGLAVGEMAAQAGAQQQLAQVGQAAQLQATATEQAAAGQEEQQRQQEQELAGRREESALRNRIQTESVLRNLEQGRAELGEKQRQQGLEQVAANLRLQDAQYIDNLRREGDRARLKEDLSFSEQLKKSIFEDNVGIARMRLQNKALLNANEREFSRALAQMDIDSAIQAARDNLKSSSEAAMIGGAASLGMAGLNAYGSGTFDSDYQDYTSSVPENQTPMSYDRWRNFGTTQESRTSFRGPTRQAAGKD